MLVMDSNLANTNAKKNGVIRHDQENSQQKPGSGGGIKALLATAAVGATIAGWAILPSLDAQPDGSTSAAAGQQTQSAVLPTATVTALATGTATSTAVPGQTPIQALATATDQAVTQTPTPTVTEAPTQAPTQAVGGSSSQTQPMSTTRSSR
jgi:hypothetical protein